MRRALLQMLPSITIFIAAGVLLARIAVFYVIEAITSLPLTRRFRRTSRWPDPGASDGDRYEPGAHAAESEPNV